MECLVASERTTETAELLAQLEMEADPELVARVRQVAEGIDTNEAHSTEGDESAAQADGAGPEPEPSVLSGLSFSADPSFGVTSPIRRPSMIVWTAPMLLRSLAVLR